MSLPPLFATARNSAYGGVVNPTPIKVNAPSGARPYIVPCPVDWNQIWQQQNPGQTYPVGQYPIMGVNFALGSLQTGGQFDALLSVIIDNRNNNRPVNLVFGDTGWTIECPAQTLKSYPIVSNLFQCTLYCDTITWPLDQSTKLYFSNVPSQIFDMEDSQSNMQLQMGTYGIPAAKPAGDYSLSFVFGLSALNSMGSGGYDTANNWIPVLTKTGFAQNPVQQFSLALLAKQDQSGNVFPSYLPQNYYVTGYRLSTYGIRVSQRCVVSLGFSPATQNVHGVTTIFATPDDRLYGRQTLFQQDGMAWPGFVQNYSGVYANFWYPTATNYFIGGYVEIVMTYSMW